MKVYASPLNYPGSKRWLFNIINELIPYETEELVSPFFGSGALEFNLALRGMKIRGYEADPFLVNYWKAWLQNPEGIDYQARLLLDIYTNNELKAIKRYTQAKLEPQYFYLFNRLGFSGNPTKYVKHTIKKDNDFYTHKHNKKVFSTENRIPFDDYKKIDLTVDLLDFEETLRKHPETLKYLDPPYRGTEDLYDINRLGFDHYRLAFELKKTKNWILSYNDDPEIRLLYKGYNIIQIDMLSTYRINNKRQAKTELLIFSKEIAA